MEIRWLSEKDYDKLLETLNYTFGTLHNKTVDFLNEQPKMWVRDDERMSKHLGAFDGEVLAAVVGMYHLPCVVGGEKLDFYTTGNVATRPEYEGQGLFTKLFSSIMDELYKRGADGARLGGQRARYGRYGFEPIRAPYTHLLTEKNRTKGFGNIGTDIEFKKIERHDTTALAYCNELSRRADIYVERSEEDGYRDVYLALCTKQSTPYLALRGGKPLGYISAYDKAAKGEVAEFGPNIAEWRTEQIEDSAPMLCAWQRVSGRTVTFNVPLTEHIIQRELSRKTESLLLESHHRFKMINFDKVANALIKLRAKKEPLPKIHYVIEIEGFGKLLIHTDDTNAFCSKTCEEANISLSHADASRLLFGESDPLSTADVPAILRSVLPLPFSWCTQDYV